MRNPIKIKAAIVERDGASLLLKITRNDWSGQVVMSFPGGDDGLWSGMPEKQDTLLVIPKPELSSLRKLCRTAVEKKVACAIIGAVAGKEDNLLQRIEAHPGLVVRPLNTPFDTEVLPQNHPWREVVCQAD